MQCKNNFGNVELEIFIESFLQSAVCHIKELQFREPEYIQCPVACFSPAIQSNSFKDYSSATVCIMPRDRG
jgi:hypothetical protein